MGELRTEPQRFSLKAAPRWESWRRIDDAKPLADASAASVFEPGRPADKANRRWSERR
ncbi:hypothetical protein GCM10010411_76710 [Actinomadura fulvescens]|uniref:Uncharacterized protein n=1 Tax=Actinomadura fulvescens TaxID=46160 RepID=A0ABN3QKX1_9ACTN